MARLKPEQWADIRAAWIGTDRSIREIAREYGVTEKAIRDRADKELWGPRNASGRKREIVAAKLAGAGQSTHQNTQCVPPDPADAEADADIEVMRFSGRLFVKILHRADAMLAAGDDPDDLEGAIRSARMDGKELNSIADAARKALDGYRRVRGLDTPAPPGSAVVSPYSHMSDEELAKAIRDAETR